MMAIYVRLSLLIMAMASVNSQLPMCREDSQCSSGLFCDANAYACIKCFNCEEHGHYPPERFNQSTCLKSLAECGPCFKGFVKVYQEGSIRANCMSPDAQEYYKNWSHVVIWTAALIASLIVIGTFVQLLQTTNVYKIHKKKVFYYTHTFLSGSPIANNVPSLPPTPDFNSTPLPNIISSIGFDYMTARDTKNLDLTKYIPLPHPSSADDRKRSHAFLSARVGIDIIAKLKTEKRGSLDNRSMTSLIVYQKKIPKKDTPNPSFQ